MWNKNYFLTHLLILVVLGCNSPGTNAPAPMADSISATPAEATVNDTLTTATTPDNSTAPAVPDQSPASQGIADQATAILKLLKAKDYPGLAAYVHPDKSLLFSPYAFIQEKSAVTLPVADLTKPNRQKRYHWGAFDGSGEPIELTLDQYFDKFVYDADFINKGTRSVNKIQKQGNTINNMHKVFPGSEFVEYHIPGLNPEYRGMDWTTLRLVFTEQAGRTYLSAIIHDSWTI